MVAKPCGGRLGTNFQTLTVSDYCAVQHAGVSVNGTVHVFASV